MTPRESDEPAGRAPLPVGRANLLATRLPPLNLFRAFEAAAWHTSFTLAAEELGVTQSAISQQVRQLEEFLGMRLFQRSPRRLQLTPEGAIFASTVREALAMMGRACARLRDPGTPSTLNVSVYPSFGARWLGRRIAAFVDRHPQIKVTIMGSKDTVQFSRQGVDIAVRWGNGTWPGAIAQSLGRQPIFPVCSPAYLASARKLRRPRDLTAHRLLQMLDGNHWPAWFEAAGEPGVTFDQGVHFSDATMMLDACAEGQGIGLASYLLLEGDLRSGRLVRAFDFGIEIGEGFHLLWDASLASKPPVGAFRDWILAEAAETLAAAGNWSGHRHDPA